MRTAALTLRGAERDYGIARATISAAIRAGELSAARLGAKRLCILRTDLERWLRQHAVRPDRNAEAVVQRVLAREARSRT